MKAVVVFAKDIGVCVHDGVISSSVIFYAFVDWNLSSQFPWQWGDI